MRTGRNGQWGAAPICVNEPHEISSPWAKVVAGHIFHFLRLGAPSVRDTPAAASGRTKGNATPRTPGGGRRVRWPGGGPEGLLGDGRWSQAPATRALSCFLPHVGAVFRRLFPLAYVFRQRPYRVEYTGSLPNSAVKRRRARLVLGWGTAWESLGVLLAFLSPRFHSNPSAENRAAAPPCAPQWRDATR